MFMLEYCKIETNTDKQKAIEFYKKEADLGHQVLKTERILKLDFSIK